MKAKKLFAYCTAVCLSIQSLLSFPVYAEETAETISAQISTNEIPGWPEGPDITSSAGIILEDSSNLILYGKNMDAPLYPGSTVKIMTMLLALENSDLNDEVMMTSTGVSGVTDGGVSISSQLGEVFTMEQCMYAIMLASANDIALQVAEHVGGTVTDFVSMMNARAAELGCTNTVFTNPTGLPDLEQHTTAHDMALIMQAALKNDAFRVISQAQSYNIPATNLSGGARALTNALPMLTSSSPSYYEGCLGGKLGFTNASGETLVCSAERGDLTLICVVLQGASNATVTDAVSLLNYGFENFQFYDLGRDDFDVLSGGLVLAPKGSTQEQITFEESESEDGQIQRTYRFGEISIGSALCSKPSKEDTKINTDTTDHFNEAREYTARHNEIPYFIIGSIGLILIILLFFLMVKVIKS